MNHEPWNMNHETWNLNHEPTVAFPLIYATFAWISEPRTRTKLFSFPFHLCLSWILHSFGLTFMLLIFLNLWTKNQNQTNQFSFSVIYILKLWTRIQNQLLLHSFSFTFMLHILFSLSLRCMYLPHIFILNLLTRTKYYYSCLLTKGFLWRSCVIIRNWNGGNILFSK